MSVPMAFMRMPPPAVSAKPGATPRTYTTSSWAPLPAAMDDRSFPKGPAGGGQVADRRAARATGEAIKPGREDLLAVLVGIALEVLDGLVLQGGEAPHLARIGGRADFLDFPVVLRAEIQRTGIVAVLGHR